MCTCITLPQYIEYLYILRYIPSHCYISVVQRLSVKHTMGVESCFQIIITDAHFAIFFHRVIFLGCS